MDNPNFMQFSDTAGTTHIVRIKDVMQVSAPLIPEGYTCTIELAYLGRTYRVATPFVEIVSQLCKNEEN